MRTPLTPYHEHNAAAARPKLIARLQEGAAIALISDAGTPLVSDPGYKLVREAYAAGCVVTALPGPSAVLAALTQSGIATDRFSSPVFSRRKRRNDAPILPRSSPFARRSLCSRPARRIGAAFADLAAAFGRRDAADLSRS